MNFWRRKEPYHAGDRVFAILRHPDVAVLLTCDAPGYWSLVIFDLHSKQPVLKEQRRGSLADVKRFGIVQVKSMYQVVDPNVLWHEAVIRSDMMQV
jgi:hypothetical protein